MTLDAYKAHTSLVFWLVAFLIGATPLIGYAITALSSVAYARFAAWMYVIFSVSGMSLLCHAEPGGFRMLAITGVLLYAMKAVVAVESIADGEKRLTLRRWLGFAILWTGMRQTTFQKRAAQPCSGAGRLAIHGITMAAIGLTLALLARWLWLRAGQHELIVTTLILMAGVSLMLHFGLFSIMTACWRFAGFDCRPLFRAPFLSTSLSEFWGKRWNLAFSHMTAIGVYRPLVRKIGPRSAGFAAFLFSGLLHEIAISLPVMTGFGLPMLYFIVHGLLVLLERKLEAAGHPVNRIPWLGRVWVMAWIILPAGILFHRAFLRGIIWPLIGIR